MNRSPAPFSVRSRLAGAALLLLICCGANVAPDRRSVTYPAHTMGTYVHVTLVTADSVASAPVATRALRVFTYTDSLMSNWTTTSEVARVNREAAAATVTVQPEVAGVIARSLEVWEGTEGTFDITVEPLMRVWGFLGGTPHVPADSEVAAAYRHVGRHHLQFDAGRRTLRFDQPGVRIDLGGIAKGYAVDVAADTLRAHGVRDALVDLTGNMMAMGHSASGTGWRIGIRDPRDRMPYFARLELHDEGISTSGKYEQFVAAGGRTFGHIMDPRTGRPAEGLISVTLVSKSAYTCDAWDTPLFVLGLDEAKKIALQHADFAAIFVEPGAADVDTVWVESSLRDRFVLEPEANRFFRVAYF
jgi:FAD:protein FMN transferase